MRTVKVSVTLDADRAAEATTRVREGGFSRFLARAPVHG